MKKFRFFWLVFKNSQLQCDAETEQVFQDDEELVRTMVTYAAQQSGVRRELSVASLCLNKSLNYPLTEEGQEQNTHFILKQVAEVGRHGGLRWELCGTCAAHVDTNKLPVKCPQCSSEQD